jgi:signal peptide peptidase SppA
MRVTDVLSAPWAIVPEKLSEICSVYRRHASGGKADFEAIEAATGKPPANARESYSVIDGVAVVPLDGVICKRMNLMTAISGGTSSRVFALAMSEAAADPEAHSIVVAIDSPGGAVDGTQAAMQAVRAARSQKRVVAVASGLMASAAYWIGSAAESVWLEDETTTAGSIGVVATHEDWSRAEDAHGLRVTEVTAGRYKRIASEHAPLSPEGRADIQAQVDAVYTVFVDDVAANRGRDAETVARDMADGKVFVGRKAVEAGLADGIRPLAEVIRVLNQQRGAYAPGRVTMEKVVVLGVECASQAEVDSALEGVGREKDEACGKAVAEERARVLAIEASALPGHEALVARMKADGTGAADAAVRILAAEKAKLAQTNANLAADAPPLAPSSEPGQGRREPDSKELAKLAQEFVDSEAAQGRKTSYAAAVAHFTAKGQ